MLQRLRNIKKNRKKEAIVDTGAGVFPLNYNHTNYKASQAKLLAIFERDLAMEKILKITMIMKPHLTQGGLSMKRSVCKKLSRKCKNHRKRTIKTKIKST